jgi:hypothetical protein
MTLAPPEAARLQPPPYVRDIVSRILANCLDIRSIWSLDHDPDKAWTAKGDQRLLAFADRETLERLRKCDHLHRSDVELMVVLDGDVFETAWGARKLSGSLARWAWRQASAHEAYYEESRWEQRGDPERIVRVRRKALLVWQAG